MKTLWLASNYHAANDWLRRHALWLHNRYIVTPYVDPHCFRGLGTPDLVRIGKVMFPEETMRMLEIYRLEGSRILYAMPDGILKVKGMPKMHKVDPLTIDVARDAWLEDQGGTRFEGILEEYDIPKPIRNYIRKRFEKEAAADFDQRWRITALSWEHVDGRYEVTDNTPGY